MSEISRCNFILHNRASHGHKIYNTSATNILPTLLWSSWLYMYLRYVLFYVLGLLRYPLVELHKNNTCKVHLCNIIILINRYMRRSIHTYIVYACTCKSRVAIFNIQKPFFS